MKQTITLLLAALILQAVSAQTKKTVAKKSPSKTVMTNKEPLGPPSPCNGENAGKYAKAFANRMYNTDPVYGDSHRGLNVQILDWRCEQSGDGAWYYFIRLNLSWQEGIGAWDWKDVKYKGVIMTDQYGCSTSYIITEKAEPSILGLAKRVGKLPPEQIEQCESLGDWFTGAKYVWSPPGCLD